MKNQKELLDIIQKQIDRINENLSNLRLENPKEVAKNKKIIEQNKALTDLTFLSSFDISELRRILPPTFEHELVNLEFYIKVLNMRYGNETKNNKTVLEQIKEILSRIDEYLSEAAKKNEQAQVLINTSSAKKEKLSKIKEKINANEEYTSDDIKTVYELLKTLSDRKQAIDLLINFGEELLSEHDAVHTKNVSEPEEIYYENENIKELEEAIRKVFKKYNLNFDEFYNKLSQKEKETFMKRVKPERVEEILEVLKEFNISLNDSYHNNKLLVSRAKELRKILLYSDKETMRKVLTYVEKENIKTDEIVDEFGKSKSGINFNLLVEATERFIERKRRKINRGNETIDISLDSDCIGAADDFINNIELFKTLGISPIEVCKIIGTSTLPTERIRKVLAMFELYGIKTQQFNSTLSCFCGTRHADAMDQFIELGCFDYIQRNMSRCQLLADNPIFYRLAYGLKHTKLPIQSMFSKNGNFTALISENSKNSSQSFGITAQNKQRMVNQTATFYGNQEVYKSCNELVDPLASSIRLALSRADSIVHVLDKYFLVKDENGKMVYPNVYNFGQIDIPRGKWNINISRNKVLRICNELMLHNVDISKMDTIMYIITKNSILTQEEYNIIYEQIDKVRKKGVGK